jgi:hypothetical protein
MAEGGDYRVRKKQETGNRQQATGNGMTGDRYRDRAARQAGRDAVG